MNSPLQLRSNTSAFSSMSIQVPDSPTAVTSSSIQLPYLEREHVFRGEQLEVEANHNHVPKLSLKMRRRGTTRIAAHIIPDDSPVFTARSSTALLARKTLYPSNIRVPSLSRGEKGNQVANPAA